ncbi:MAG: DUF3667 domain-containing protein, partial [Saprospiraceae bacterium]
MPYKAKFCAQCGQKDTDGRIGMGSLMVRMWNNTFHLEGKFIRTAWHLFVPGKVTVEFFKGKQERYPHPIRLFAIVMFLFLFLLNSMLKNREPQSKEGLFSFTTKVKSETGDTILKEQPFSLYEQMKLRAMRYDMQQDWERLPAAWKTSQAKSAVDSLLSAYSGRYGLETSEPMDTLLQEPLDSVGLSFNGVKIATLDLVRYEPDEIIRRYHFTNWFDRLVVRQAIKSYKTPDALAHAYVGSLTWAILVLVAFMSGVLALLYWRQRRYYVEHFIFLLHFHTGAMLLLLLAILGNRWGLWSEGAIGWAAFLPMPAMFFALLRYYQQGLLKTFVKWLLYGFLYLFAFT